MAVSANKKTLTGIGLLLLLLIGVGAYFYFQGPSVKPTLYVYYPESTTVYVELEPGEKLMRRMLIVLDQNHVLTTRALATRNLTHMSSGIPKTGSARKQGSNAPNSPQTGSIVLDQNQTLKAGIAQKPNNSEFSQVFIDTFNKTFRPHVSLGVWPLLAQTAGQPAQPQDAAENTGALMIFPMKAAMTFPQLVSQFNGDLSQFRKETGARRIDYYISQDNASAFAVVNNQLFITNGRPAMITLLEELSPDQQRLSGKNVFDHPTQQKYLPLLPSHREGTLLVNNTAYTDPLKLKSNPANRLGKKLLTTGLNLQAARYARILPVTLGALNIEGNQRLVLSFFTPVLVSDIQNKALAKALRAIYLDNKPIISPQAVPATTTYLMAIRGLDQWYDLYTAYLMGRSQSNMIQGVAGMLSLMQLDLRKDIVGLFSGETAFANQRADDPPALLLENTLENTQNKSDNQPQQNKSEQMKRLVTLFTSGKFFPIEHREQQIGSVPTIALTVPHIGKSVSVGFLDKKDKMLGVAETSQFEALVNVNTHQAQALADRPAFVAVTKDLPRNLNLFFFADVNRETAGLRKQLQSRLNARGHQLQLPDEDWLDTVSGGLWGQPVNDREDLIQAKLILQMKPKS